MDRLLELVSFEFEKALAVKTDWNKNEIIAVFYRAWFVAMTKYKAEKGYYG